MGVGEREDCPGRTLLGFVPALFRDASLCAGCVGIGTEEGEVRSCAAEKDGRRSLREAIVPVIASEEMLSSSSPLAGDPTEPNVSPACDLLSVEDVPALPLRFRLMYFSISSASRSRIRFTMGDSDV